MKNFFKYFVFLNIKNSCTGESPHTAIIQSNAFTSKAEKTTFQKHTAAQNYPAQSLETTTNSAALNSAVLHNENIKKANPAISMKSKTASNENLLLMSDEQTVLTQSVPVHDREKDEYSDKKYIDRTDKKHKQTVSVNDCESNQAKQYIKSFDSKCNKTNGSGLAYYRKWWELTEVELMVNGNLIIGTPIFIEENTLRLINDNCSYFIPLEKVDYIRTKDGLQTSFDLSND